MILREMLVEDLDQVMEIEQDLFHVPWTKEGFFTFLTKENAMFLVVEEPVSYTHLDVYKRQASKSKRCDACRFCT